MSAPVLYTIPQDVLNKMATLNGEEYARVSWFLLQTDNPENYVRVLRSSLNNDAIFKSCVQLLFEDTMKLKDSPEYIDFMDKVWNNYLKPNMLSDGEVKQYVDFSSILTADLKLQSVVTYNFLKTLSNMPLEAQLKAINATVIIAEKVLSSGNALMVRQTAQGLISSAKTTAGKLLPVALVAVVLAYDVLVNIRRWWKGEISGTRLIKNVIDSGVGVGCGIGGSVVGASIGGAVFPGVGTVVGGFIGGLAGSKVGNLLSDWLTQKFFGLPKEEALENAYRFLKLNFSASNGEINTTYRRLALEYHPDKGGNKEEWHKLQYSVAIIKASKGEI